MRLLNTKGLGLSSFQVIQKALVLNQLTQEDLSLS
jgi:hypothetical protein